jgi:predicted amidophosphoribosyltransferase
VGSEDKIQTDKSEARKHCSCPFCDAPVKKVYPFCEDCGKELDYCEKCGKPLPPGRHLCPDCKE